MLASSQLAKPAAKRASKSKTPHPDFITQVQQDDESTQRVSPLTRLYGCCHYFWKCFSSAKQNDSFDQIHDPSIPALLEPQLPEFKGRKTLVLDLDETLVHSTFEPVQNADLVMPVHIQGMTYKINVIKRPGCEEFLARMGDLYEVVVFTASLSEYAEPLCKILDTTNVISSILYRQHCTPLNGVYVKDMTLLGRDMKDIILVDNSPNSFLFQPENAYHIKNFFDDKSDRELYRLATFLENITGVSDVRPIEDLRRQYEPRPNQKAMKFVKVDREEIAELDESTGTVKYNPQQAPQETKNRQQDRERAYNVETEPDLRKDYRGEEYQQFAAQLAHRDNRNDDYKPFNGYGAKAGALTERVSSDRPQDNVDDLELPSPKESDMLIRHDSTQPLNKKKKTPFIPPLAKDADAFNKLTREKELVVVDDPVIDGHKVEDVRLLPGMGNLNSPLGRHVEIKFNGKDQESMHHLPGVGM